MRGIALTTDTSLLTACANDRGFDEVFARQVEALAEPGDLLILHSTSGESPNVIRAAQSAKARGVGVVALLGRTGGQLKHFARCSSWIRAVSVAGTMSTISAKCFSCPPVRPRSCISPS